MRYLAARCGKRARILISESNIFDRNCTKRLNQLSFFLCVETSGCAREKNQSLIVSVSIEINLVINFDFVVC